MRKAEFNVPSEVMEGFADAMAERELGNTVAGTTEDGEIVIEVMYEKDETKEVDALEEILEKLRSEMEEEDEDDN